jgi:hypothetical protein
MLGPRCRRFSSELLPEGEAIRHVDKADPPEPNHLHLAKPHDRGDSDSLFDRGGVCCASLLGFGGSGFVSSASSIAIGDSFMRLSSSFASIVTVKLVTFDRALRSGEYRVRWDPQGALKGCPYCSNSTGERCLVLAGSTAHRFANEPF